MAIIRIKRTTTSNLPTGLTFGELAFVQGSGATANRLYIQTNDAGVCVWIGAEILNSPTYWSGITAETTVPTVGAVQSFVNAFVGATVFSSDIVANLGGTKSFGKWTNGQTVTASGKTPIQVITEALIESVVMGVTLTTRAGFGDPVITYSAIPFGATAIRIGLTWGYQINTPGATALGGTLEWKRANESSYTAISNPPGSTFVYDTTSPFYTQVTPNGFTLNPFNHSFTQTQYNTNSIDYRYTVHDSSGAGATTATASVSLVPYANPTNSTTVAAQLSEPLGGSSTVFRERGNTGSTLSITFSVNTNDTRWINLTAYQVQYQLNGTGSWYNALTNAIDDTFTSISPPAGSHAAVISVKPTIAGITLISYRARVKDTFNSTTSGVVTNPQPIATVSLRKRIFYGATYTNFFNNVTTQTIRSLPFSILGPTSGTAISGASPFSFTFNTSTDGSLLRYVIALPKGLTLNTNADVNTGGVGAVLSTGEVLAGKSNPSDDPCQLNLGLTQGTDFSGVVHDYNIFTWTLGDQYTGTGTTITVRSNGTVT